MNKTKTVFITGASSGIGRACAQIFSRSGYRLILNARRAEVINNMATSLTTQYGVKVRTAVFNVTNCNEVKESIQNLPKDWQQIDILINNAGLALGKEPVHQGHPEDWDKVIDTNVKGLLYVSRYITPLMISNNKGHIINIGSMASKDVYFGGNVYCATKFALDAITQSMRYELLPHNIKVSAIHPGRTRTGFSMVRFKGDLAKSEQPYKGFIAMQPEDVASVIYYVSTLPDHVNITDLVVTPSAQADSTYFNTTK